jgi:NADPH:quinone reductase-like Zn-dependent oxidoreductase
MRAIVVDGCGPTATARLSEVPVPVPAADQVVVQVAYASVNPADWKCRDGWMLRFPQFQPSYPFGLGFDGAGLITAVGDGVTDRRVGERVFVRANQMTGQNGTFAEYVCVSHTDTAPMPEGLPFLDATTVPVAGLTAWQSVMKYGAVQAGQSVLINGGAGGVGSFAAQFARVAGARVAATASPRNFSYLKGLGCELVIDYNTENIRDATLAWAPDGVDLLVDTVNIEAIPDAGLFVRRGGAIVPIVTLGEPARYDADELATHGVRLVDATVKRDEASDDMVRIGTVMVEHGVTVPAIEVLDLADAQAAMDLVRDGHVRGKLVLGIAPEL